jgi:PAS domain S-box-containing protein
MKKPALPPKYKQAFMHAGVGIWEFDVQTQRFCWDDGCKQLFETDMDSCTLEEWYQFIYTEDQKDMQEFVSDALSEKVEVEKFFKVKTSKNTTKYLRSSAFKVKDKDGQLLSFVGVSWDVTNESVLQNELVKEKKFTELILNSIPDPIFVKNQNHQWIYANTEFEKLLGYKKSEFILKSDHDFFEKAHADVYWKKDNEVFKSGRSNENEEKIVDSFGETRDILTKKTPIELGNDEKLLVGVIRDITAMKEIQNSLIEKSKMASLGEMAAGIGHEINNPLTIIQGKAQLLQEKLSRPGFSVEKLRKDLELIEQNCARIDRIIKSLRSVARKSDLDPFEAVSLLSVIDEAFEISKQRFRRSKLSLCIIKERGVDYHLKTMVRPSEIVQVLVNLLNNAYDAIQHQPRGWARLIMSADEKFLQVEVIDSGPEIQPEVALRMMEPFFTTKSTGKGTGLGLSVSKQIIENHSGELFFDKEHPNTRFVFRLPRSAD